MKTRFRTIGIVTALFGLLLVACGGDSTTTTTTEAPKPVAATAVPQAAAAEAPAAAPKNTYNELVWAHKNWHRNTLLPADVTPYAILSPIYDLPWEIDGDPMRDGKGFINLVPHVVKEWKYSKDLKVVTITINDGITFSNGTPLTSADVAFLPDYYRKGPHAKTVLTGRWNKDSVAARVKGPLVAEFYRTDGKPFSPEWVLSDLATRMAGFASKAYIDKVGYKEADKNPIGSGPFKLIKSAVDELVYEKRGSHFKYPDPPMNRIKALHVPESSVRLSLIQADRADVANELTLQDAKTAKDKGHTLHIDPAGKQVRVIFGGTTTLQKGKAPWVASKDVRLAMAMAIDRQTMIEELTFGLGSLMDVNHPSPNGTHIKGYPYDPTKAKDLLKNAGYANGFDVDTGMIIISNAPRIGPEHEAIVNYWKKIGLNATIKPWNWGSAKASWNKQDPAATDGRAWVMSFTFDPGTSLAEWSRYSVPHLSTWRDEKLLGLIAEMEGAGLDAALFNAKEKAAFDYMHDLVAFIPVYTIPEVDGFAKSFVKWNHPGRTDQKVMYGLVFDK